jgi:hypothetical protein
MKLKQKKAPRSLRIMLMPLMALVFLAGFIASIVGEKKNSQKRIKTPAITQKVYDLKMQLNVPDEKQTVEVE